jgi:hypothetical protein
MRKVMYTPAVRIFDYSRLFSVALLAVVVNPACSGSSSKKDASPDSKKDTSTLSDATVDAATTVDITIDTALDISKFDSSGVIQGEAGQATPLTIVPATPQTMEACMGSPNPPTITFQVPNSGNVTMNRLVTSITGIGASFFTATTSGCDLIAPGGICTISVSYRPIVVTGDDATLTVADQTTGASTPAIPLHGFSYSCGPLRLTTAKSDLGSVPIGTTSAAVDFKLDNSGDSPVSDLRIGLSSSEFVILDDTCTGAGIPAGRSCTFGVALRPLTVGPKTAVLAIEAEPSGIPPIVKTLMGTGISRVDAGQPMDSGLDQGEAGPGEADSLAIDGSSG